MDIAQMRMMLVLAESKSITTTAKKLRVTQPALTYQLKVIEKELGFRVFNRTRTGTSYTAEGAFLHDTIKKIVNDYDEAVRLARAMTKGASTGTIRVGVNDYSRDTISFFLNVAQSALSFTLIPCGSTDPIKLLQDRVIDFWSASDAAMETAPASMRFTTLTSSNQSVFVPVNHHLASHESLTVEDLADEVVWLWPRGTASNCADRIRRQLEKHGTEIENFIPGVPAVVAAVGGDGVVIYDDGFLPPSANTTVQIPLTDAGSDALGLVYLASQEKRLKPAIAALKERIAYNEGLPASGADHVAQRIVALLDDISTTVRRGGMKDIVPLIEYGLELGISANQLLNRGLLIGMNAAGEAFSKGEIFMTEMMAAVSTTNLAMEILQPRFAVEDERTIVGSAAIGTVLGDQHDIGKNLVRIMLESRDINVADLGRQVTPQAFVEHVQNNADCNLVLISAGRRELLGNVEEVIEAFKKAKLRDSIFIMVGGAALTPEFAEEIGADAYTASAEDAAAKAVELLSV